MSTTDIDRRVESLLRLPWSLRLERNEDDGYLILRVAELPSVLATGADEQSLLADLWHAMRATLRSFLEDGEPVPRPQRGGKVERDARISWATREAVRDDAAWTSLGADRPTEMSGAGLTVSAGRRRA